MGDMQLSEYRSEVKSALGDRGVQDSRVNRWVNWAYREMAGALRFETFAGQNSVQSSSGDNSLSAPADLMGITAVVDDDQPDLLGWVPKHEFFRRNRSEEGTPRSWTHHQSSILLHPTPDSQINYLVLYHDVPDQLSADSDTTAVSPIWDQALFLLGVHYALMALGEEQRAQFWFQRSVSFIQTRITEEDLERITAGRRPSWGGRLMNAIQGGQDG